jgi:hypothetical protein
MSSKFILDNECGQIKMQSLTQFKPALPRRYLLLISGLMWSMVGLMLCRLAIKWYIAQNLGDHWIYILGGVVLALPIHRLGFSTFATSNINRSMQLPEKPCIFAFMSWWNYPLVAFMIALGLALRHSVIPKSYLGILYIGIGGGLILSSILYYQALISPSRKEEFQP